MTIRIVCKNCNSKIDAKDELLGQTRRCPKCHNPILVKPEAPQIPSVSIDVDQPLKIRRLRPDNFYVILGTDIEVAHWRGGDGWFVNVGNGFQAIKSAPDKIPDVGTFVLVEGYVAQTSNGRRLKGLRFSQLSGRSVLKALTHSDAAAILYKAEEPTVLTSVQKRLVLQHIRNHYFFEFTDDAPEIVEYLTGFESSSHEVGTFIDE